MKAPIKWKLNVEIYYEFQLITSLDIKIQINREKSSE